MANVVTNEELGRRIAAARGYSLAPSRTEFAERMVQPNTGRETWRHYEEGNIPPTKRDWLIGECRRITGLPAEFFEIELDELPAMVRHWRAQGDELKAVHAALRRAEAELGALTGQAAQPSE